MSVLGFGFVVKDLRFGVKGSGCNVSGVGLRVYGSVFMVRYFWCRVQD